MLVIVLGSLQPATVLEGQREGWDDRGKDKGDCAHGPSGWQDEGQSQRGLV